MRDDDTRLSVWAPWLLVWTGLALVLVYWVLIEVPQTDLRMARHAAVLEGSTRSPYHYRLLSVLYAEGARAVLSPILGDRRSFHLIYLAWNVVGSLGLLLGQYRLLSRWFHADTALWGSLVLVPAMILSFADPIAYFAPFSIIEGAAMVWTLTWAMDGRRWLVLVAVALGALNRETAVLAALMATAVWWPGPHGLGSSLASVRDAPGPVRSDALDPDRGRGVRAPAAPGWLAAPMATWAVVYGSVRLIRGSAPPAITLPQILEANTGPASLAWAAVLFGLFLGPLWIAALRGWRNAPAILRRAAISVPPALGLYLIFGIWREVRILLVILPIVAALAVFGVVRPNPRLRATE